MTAQNKPTIWTRMKRVFTGKPVSHEESQAARARHAQDIAAQTQLDVRSQRFTAGM